MQQHEQAREDDNPAADAGQPFALHKMPNRPGLLVSRRDRPGVVAAWPPHAIPTNVGVAFAPAESSLSPTLPSTPVL